MIFVGPYLSNPNSHFNINIIDSIGRTGDLAIDVKEDIDYLAQIKEHLKGKNIADEICIYNPFEKEDLVIKLKQEIPGLKILMYCSDDEWRCFNYDRYLALYVDFFTITAKKHLRLYNSWGFYNVMTTNWACNPQKFYPINVEKKYDVTFIGSAYGLRVDYVKEAIRAGINIKVFGKGWGKYREIKSFWGGYVSSEEMNLIINQSRINLNFMWSSQGEYHQVKGRCFELSGCNAFQLCNHEVELLGYFEPKKNIDTFNDKKEFIAKINYYLRNVVEREDIASRAYEDTIQNHTWDMKFKEILNFGMTVRPIALNKFNVRVMVENGAKHCIKEKDDRLNIHFENNNMEYDGVIRLTKNTTISNDALFMMVFALYADKSDIVVSNFYVGDVWIRFRDKNLKDKKKLLNLIPIEAKMFKNRMSMESDLLNKDNISTIEYPTFEISGMNMVKSFVLSFLFSSYSKREKIAQYKQNKNILGILMVASNHVCRKIILK